MKNKDKYDLRKLNISINHLIDGCGKRIEKPYFINIKLDDKFIVKEEKVKIMALNWLMEWLEMEDD